jgi:histidine triad (HIT) family protein
MTNCIFCKIINKQIPCFKIYENKYVLSFLDINPILKGHILVIPKKHFTNVLDTDDFYLSEVIKVVKLISNNIKQKLNCDGINILNASGKAAEQSVMHLHFHILPRYDNDKLNTFPKTKYIKKDLTEIQKILKID